MHKDNDYIPRLWDYDNTGEAVVLSQKELKSLRDELNKEYLRRWSGFMGVSRGNHESIPGHHENRWYTDVPVMDPNFDYHDEYQMYIRYLQKYFPDKYQDGKYDTYEDYFNLLAHGRQFNDRGLPMPNFNRNAWDPVDNMYRAVGTFTSIDGEHRVRLVNGVPNQFGALETPTPDTNRTPAYQNADGNIEPGYWGTLARKDFRGCPIYYSPMDRYVDGEVLYDISSDTAPRVESNYTGPTAGMTFPLGATEWKDETGSDPNTKYNPFGFTDVTKDRSFKHLIDGLANIVDIDKYYGHGVRQGDPVIPQNPVQYGNDQTPHNSERTEHLYRNTGNTSIQTPGSNERLNRPSSLASWIPILKREQRNEYYIRACNYHHWIWYFKSYSYYARYQHQVSGDKSGETPVSGSGHIPATSNTLSQTFIQVDQRNGKERVNYNPSYYGHRESYTSCLTACTGFCSQSCFHVCDEACVYLCDDKCGYSCMDGGYTACGSVCIANCRDNCGGPTQEGGSGNNTCQSSCTGGSGQTPAGCTGQCSGNCSGFMKDEQACPNDCVAWCSMGCNNICMGGCKFNCSSTPCMVSCTSGCNSDILGSSGCAKSQGNVVTVPAQGSSGKPGAGMQDCLVTGMDGVAGGGTAGGGGGGCGSPGPAAAPATMVPY